MKWLREPLVHFLLLGALLFAVFAAWGGPAVSAPGQYHIVVTPTMVQNLVLGFQRSTQREPNAQEVDAMVADFVREEILNREARALNLDQDDPLVRRQLRQKMEFYLAERAGDPSPTDAQLQDYLQKNAAAFRRPDGSLPEYKDLREKLVAIWQYEQRRANAATAYDELRKHYVVEIQKATAAKSPAPPPTGTTAATKANGPKTSIP